MFGLERSSSDAMELRRMYVHPSARRLGIARAMLALAEAETRRSGSRKLELSTSELQPAAVELYRRAGYRLVREETVDQASHKTIGGGIRRYHFEKTTLIPADIALTRAANVADQCQERHGPIAPE